MKGYRVKVRVDGYEYLSKLNECDEKELIQIIDNWSNKILSDSLSLILPLDDGSVLIFGPNITKKSHFIFIAEE